MEKIKILLILLLAIPFFGYSQQYDGVKIEKWKVDKNNKIFKIGSTFIYTIQIKKNKKEYFLDKMLEDTLIAIGTDVNKVDKIKLSVIKPKIFQRTNKNQTEIKYNFEPDPNSLVSTGVAENRENVWIHPPRLGFLKVLETCPFPYIKLDKIIGYKWNDKMSISNYWSNKNAGLWTGRLLLDYNYEIIAKENMATDLGQLDCTVISATATSSIGKSILLAYYNDKYGFVKLKYTLFNGTEILLNLNKIL